MELSKKERLSFVYQLRILEALYPQEADVYSQHRTALEKGFALQYEAMFEHLYDELSVDDCKEVLDILDMYRAITFGLNNIDKSDPIHNHYLSKFVGFDGNNETKQFSYTEYFIIDLNRFSELRKEKYDYFNSHAPMLDTYRRMLRLWRGIKERFKLSRADIATILGDDA